MGRSLRRGGGGGKMGVDGRLPGIKSGKRQPSSAFVALLYLVAQPDAIPRLERFFAFLGGPENLG